MDQSGPHKFVDDVIAVKSESHNTTSSEMSHLDGVPTLSVENNKIKETPPNNRFLKKNCCDVVVNFVGGEQRNTSKQYVSKNRFLL